MRINARLDEKTEQQLTYIRATTKQSLTDIIKHSLSLYYQQLRSETGEGTRKLLQSDFIGCAEGPEDLSSHYKHYLRHAGPRGQALQ
jgi:hypothetical protein